jgi:hypothetical protein
MEMRDMVIVVLVASIFGALGGFVAGRYSVVPSFEEKIAAEGISVSEVRWVDERGQPRLSVQIPPDATAQITPYLGEGEPVVSILDAQGAVEASAVISAGVINRAAGL